MNSSMVRYILGYVLMIEAALLGLPCITSLIYREGEGFYFLVTALICLAIGILMTRKKPENTVFYFKEGCVSTALSWICMSIFGALPFTLCGDIPNYTDALFETISGFTTTGSSILEDVEALSHCSLIWRSFTHWIGGMGILVVLLAIIPLGGGSRFNLMKAESPGPSVGKLVPKVRYTAQLLYYIYVGLTLLELVFLLLGRMSLFDALCTSFGTAGTGGFGVKGDSIAGYSPYIQWVTGVFMLMFGINFNAYYYILLKQVKKAGQMREVQAYLLIILSSVTFITISLMKTSVGFGKALRDAFFQVASIITTTGFATADFDQWSVACRTLLVMLMFCGACAGSTGGGIKVSRLIVMLKTVIKELNSYIHPKSIKKIKMDGKAVEHEVVRATNVFLITYIIIFVCSLFIVSLEGNDIVTNFTAIAATINNIGPGLNMVGPTMNFHFIHPLSKYVMMFDMLAGRLELFPLLILFHPSIWKELAKQKVNKIDKTKKPQKGKALKK